MAWVDTGLGRQFGNAAEAGCQRLSAAPREVGASHTVAEERVSCEQRLIASHVEADATRGVTGRVEDGNLDGAERQGRALPQGELRLGRGGYGQTEDAGSSATQQKLAVLGVDPQDDAGTCERSVSGYVIEVPVGVENVAHVGPVRINRVADRCRILEPGVDDGGDTGAGIEDEVAV